MDMQKTSSVLALNQYSNVVPKEHVQKKVLKSNKASRILLSLAVTTTTVFLLANLNKNILQAIVCNKNVRQAVPYATGGAILFSIFYLFIFSNQAAFYRSLFGIFASMHLTNLIINGLLSTFFASFALNSLMNMEEIEQQKSFTYLPDVGIH